MVRQARDPTFSMPASSLPPLPPDLGVLVAGLPRFANTSPISRFNLAELPYLILELHFLILRWSDSSVREQGEKQARIDSEVILVVTDGKLREQRRAYFSFQLI